MFFSSSPPLLLHFPSHSQKELEKRATNSNSLSEFMAGSLLCLPGGDTWIRNVSHQRDFQKGRKRRITTKDQITTTSGYGYLSQNNFSVQSFSREYFAWKWLTDTNYSTTNTTTDPLILSSPANFYGIFPKIFTPVKSRLDWIIGRTKLGWRSVN